MPLKLPADVLAKRHLLPEKPDPVVLEGKYVRLEPLVIARDAQALFEVSNGSPIDLGRRSVNAYDPDEWIWRYLFEGPFEHVTAFIDSLQIKLRDTKGLCLCIFDVETGRQIGLANFMNNSPNDLKIELGGIWYSPIVQRTKANTEATYLMLKHLFKLGYRRLEWKCHSHNERSRRAALRMGFKFEGIQENHMIVKNCPRDTAWFRILTSEWPTVETQLEALLYHN